MTLIHATWTHLLMVSVLQYGGNYEFIVCNYSFQTAGFKPIPEVNSQ